MQNIYYVDGFMYIFVVCLLANLVYVFDFPNHYFDILLELGHAYISSTLNFMKKEHFFFQILFYILSPSLAKLEA